MGNTLDLNIDDKVFEQLKRLLALKIDQKKSIACWSSPKEKKIHLIISDEAEKLNTEFTLENLEEGFIVAPFDTEENDIYFLKADYYWNSNLALPTDEFVSGQTEAPLNIFGPGSIFNTDPENYIDLVEKSIQGIETGEFEKVVPARAKTSALPENFDAFDFFLNLTEHYPDAFVSWYFIPDIGSWVGASPELLIEIQDNKFKTMALAGTQPYETSQSIKETSWTQKEIEEQALVSRYIINCFKKIRLREFDEYGPKTVRAGNLLHLKTEFQVDLKATNFPDLGTVMLKLLHPTSAVCGMPLEKAMLFLKNNENLNRGYFSGYIGPVNINEATSLFVNLRCLQIVKDYAVAYAGAGVTIDSDPVKELNETEFKMNTLIRWLK